MGKLPLNFHCAVLGIVILIFRASLLFSEGENTTIISLDRAIEIALDKNPSQKAAQQGIYVAKYDVVSTFSAYYPDIDFIGSYTRFRERIFLPIFNLPFSTPILTNPIVGPINDWNIRIEGSYILYDSGERFAKLRASRANCLIAKEEADRIAQEIILNVSLAYYSHLSDIDLYHVALENLTRSEDHLRIATARNQVGDVPMADVLRVQVEVAEANQSVVRTKSLMRISKGNLNVTMGLTPNTPFEIEKINVTPIDPLQISIQDSFNNAVKYRPEIRSQTYRIDVKSSGIEKARSAYGPKVIATGKFGSEDTNFYPSDIEWAIGVGVTVPIFKGFRHVADLRKARGEYYQEIAGYQGIALTVQQDVWTAYSRILEAIEAINTAKAQVKDATESLRLAKSRYEVGAGTINDLLDAQTALVRAEATYVDAFNQYQSSITTFKWAQGLLGCEY